MPLRSLASILLFLALVSAASADPEAGSGSSREGADVFAAYKEDLLTRFPNMRPRVGEVALDGTGVDFDGRPVRLSDLWAERPVVLEFGTCT
jgi:hypothetical protein